MFDNLKMMGAMASLLKNKEQLQQAMLRVQQELAERVITVEGAKRGDGTPRLRVQASGTMEIRGVHIEPDLLAEMAQRPDGSAQLGMLIGAASNAALKRAREVMVETIRTEAKELGLPEIPGLEKLLGG
jgi:DNA-binding protein YbaB